MSEENPQQDTFIVFSENEEISRKLKAIFPEAKILFTHVMLEAFEMFKNYPIKAVIFDTYQVEPFIGVNETDLDILMYYASSEESQNKMTLFLPIDQEPDDSWNEQNFANHYYDRLFHKFLYLLGGIYLEDLSEDSFSIPDGLNLLGNLVNVLDEATRDLDEKITVIGGSAQVGEEAQLVSGFSEHQSEELQKISGSPEDIFEQVQKIVGSKEEKESSQIISGSQEDLGEEAQRVKGFAEEEDKTVHTISGSPEEAEEVQTISGSPEEAEEVQTISGSPEEAEEVQTISGSAQEKEHVQVISGSPADKEDQGTLRFSNQSEEDEEENYEFSSEIASDDYEESTTIEGEFEDLGKNDFMKVKSLSKQEDEEPEERVADINERNEKGQTPAMIYAKKGDLDKVRALLDSGAKEDLLCKKGKTILHYACQGSDDVDFIDELIMKYGLKLTKRDSDNRDCLFYAIIGNNSNLVEYLLNHGARIQTKYSGDPVLHVAVKSNAIKSFKSLLLFGANVQATDDSNEDIIKYCKSKKKLGFLKVLAAVSKLKQMKAA